MSEARLILAIEVAPVWAMTRASALKTSAPERNPLSMKMGPLPPTPATQDEVIIKSVREALNVFDFEAAARAKLSVVNAIRGEPVWICVQGGAPGPDLIKRLEARVGRTLRSARRA